MLEIYAFNLDLPQVTKETEVLTWIPLPVGVVNPFM